MGLTYKKSPFPPIPTFSLLNQSLVSPLEDILDHVSLNRVEQFYNKLVQRPKCKLFSIPPLHQNQREGVDFSLFWLIWISLQARNPQHAAYKGTDSYRASAPTEMGHAGIHASITSASFTYTYTYKYINILHPYCHNSDIKSLVYNNK